METTPPPKPMPVTTPAPPTGRVKLASSSNNVLYFA